MIICARPLAWSEKSFAGSAVALAQANREVRTSPDAGVLSRDLDELMSYSGPTDVVIVYNTIHPPGEFRGY